jgi:SAM-dependent methyltransferase
METTKTATLYDTATAKSFYEERYTTGYMDEWPLWKKQRVFATLRALNLPARGRALDFGCGTGVFTEVLRQALPGWTVYGADLSENALGKARARFPSCVFLSQHETAEHRGTFDLAFSHHVFEHVAQLDEALVDCVAYLKPAASMLHILPCANHGSYEHDIASLHTDGISTTLGNRYFFEDEGHVRRLSTDELVRLAEQHGFSLATELYANQRHGALRWIVELGEPFVLKITDTTQARDAGAAAELLRIRKELLSLVRARTYVKRFQGWQTKKGHRTRRLLRSTIGLPRYAVCQYRFSRLQRLAEREWQERSTERNGSEMSLFFARAGSADQERSSASASERSGGAEISA